jgi:hypothetical protein
MLRAQRKRRGDDDENNNYADDLFSLLMIQTII